MNDRAISEFWVYLSASPMLGLTVTLLAYLGAHRLYTACGAHPLLNPVAVATLALVALLKVTDTEYATYFSGAQFVHFLLGPATVALAIPLYEQAGKLRTLWPAVVLSVTLGGLLGAGSAVAVAYWLGASAETMLSLAPKSVTAPVAMGIAEKIGGLPQLTAVLVVTTGILGAVVGTPLLRTLRLGENSVAGVAIGVSAHGIGTARAFQVNSEMGAFSGLAMALSALATAVILPALIGWW